jgi:hypothetical protein
VHDAEPMSGARLRMMRSIVLKSSTMRIGVATGKDMIKSTFNIVAL